MHAANSGYQGDSALCSSIYDKLTWAAAWMYRATGDTDYLGDAESFYITHIYNEGGTEVCAQRGPYQGLSPARSH